MANRSGDSRSPSDGPSSSALSRSPSATPTAPWTPDELGILASLCRICPRGDPRWSNERFVDAFLMGRLRAQRDVAEVMAWGQLEQDPLPSPPSMAPPRLPNVVADETDDRFHPRYAPSYLAGRSASGTVYPRARSVSSAASSSRLLDVALSSTLAAPEPLARSTTSGRARFASGVSLAGPSPLGAASPPVYQSSRREPARPSGRFVAPEVSLSSWSPSQHSPPPSPGLPHSSSPPPPPSRNPADEPSAADDARSQFSWALSQTSLPADVQSHLSYSFSSRLSQGDAVPDPTLPIASTRGPSSSSAAGLTPAAHAAILLQRLPTAGDHSDGRVQEALRLLTAAGYLADVGSAGNTRPAGGADRWVFVPSTRLDDEDPEEEPDEPAAGPRDDGLGLDIPPPVRTATPQQAQPSSSRIAHRDPNPSPTTTSSSRGQPSNRGRPTTRASAAASRSRTNSTVSPSTSTRSRTAAAAAAAATHGSGSRSQADDACPPSSSPTKSSSVRSRSPSESPRPTRRARLNNGSPSVASFHSLASTKSLSTSAASASGSQLRLPTPSPEKSISPQLPTLALHADDPTRPDSPPETSEEELPIALRRPVRTTVINGGTSSAGSSLRNVQRERTGSNASSNPSSVAASIAVPVVTPDTPEFAPTDGGSVRPSTSSGVTRRRSNRASLDPAPSSSVVAAAHRRIAGSLRRVPTPAPDGESDEEGTSTPTLQRRSTTTGTGTTGSVRRLAIPTRAPTPVQDALARRRTSPQPPVAPAPATVPVARRTWLSFAAPSAPPTSASGRPILPRPRSPTRRPSLFLPNPQSPASTAGFSTMSSENELPLDRCPPPAYEPMREGAVIVQPPERRRNRAAGRAGTAQAGEGRREGGIGRIFAGIGRS